MTREDVCFAISGCCVIVSAFTILFTACMVYVLESFQADCVNMVEINNITYFSTVCVQRYEDTNQKILEVALFTYCVTIMLTYIKVFHEDVTTSDVAKPLLEAQAPEA